MSRKLVSDANKVEHMAKTMRDTANRCSSEIAASALLNAAKTLDAAVERLRKKAEYE